jgi:hypothetical protein
MYIPVRVEPFVGSPADVDYRWDSDTDILSAVVRARRGDPLPRATALELEGPDARG